MKKKDLFRATVPAAALALAVISGCNPPSDYAVGGKISGLNGELRLTLNNTETLTRTINGNYQFSTRLTTGASYSVDIASAPANQQCTLSNNIGVIAQSAITNINVTCVNLPKVTADVSGVLGNLTLQLNGDQLLAVDSDGKFQFANSLAAGTAYEVTVAAQPAGQICNAENPSGTISDEGATVLIDCLMQSDSAPTVAKINPDAWITDVDVVITGTNLGRVALAYNGSAIDITRQSATQVMFKAPDAPQGPHTLEITNSAGSTSESIIQGTVMTAVVSASSGYWSHCALLDDGRIRCWGTGGVSGNYQASDEIKYPVLITNISNAVAVDVGFDFACAVLANGQVQCWGDNQYGTLGNDVVAYSDVPVTVAGVDNAIAVSSGEVHACALISDGSVRCWGTGILGDGSNAGNNLPPATVAGITDATAIATGAGHSCALLANGNVYCWGAAEVGGELGDGSGLSSLVPIKTKGISNATAISASLYSSCALLSTGTIKCWGMKVYGIAFTPQLLAGVTNATAVNSSLGSYCSLNTAGQIQCWGVDMAGELGAFDKPSDTPVTIGGINNVQQLGEPGCAIVSGGLLKCWDLGRSASVPVYYLE